MSLAVLPPDITRLYAHGNLRDIDYFLADMLRRRYGVESPEVLLGAALASRVVSDGHVCFMLSRYGGTPWPPVNPDKDIPFRPDLGQVTLPSPENWIRTLKACDACVAVTRDRIRERDMSPNVPLVLIEDPEPMLYLARYYNYEQRVVKGLRSLAEEIVPSLGDTKRAELLRVLFPKPVDDKPRLAAETALRRRLLIISGGPGTGKTHTVARLLVLLMEDARDLGRELLIRMAAPTGKAAMRMRESIQGANERSLQALTEPQRAELPDDACTLHRLLGSRSSSPSFVYHAGNPLPADVVIVDEASMIDLPLMAKLLDALSPHSRLILLGDMHQLSSVEPGFVLGDICAAAEASESSPLGDSLVELTHSWRFPAHGAIGQFSRALHAAGREGDVSGALAWTTLQRVAASPPSDDPEATQVRWRETPLLLRDGNGRPHVDLREVVLKHYMPFLEAENPQAAFDAFAGFRILSPRRHGPHGIRTLNKLVEEILSTPAQIRGDARSGEPSRRLQIHKQFYDHRVVIVTRNDYGMRLFNGDIGIVLPENADGRTLDGMAEPRRVAWFETTDPGTGKRGFRTVPCSMLPEHETAFAMTVHKSQGSQFRDLLIVIPPEPSALLCKELLYTAITRAEQNVEIWCNEAEFLAAAIHPVERSSGLKAALEHSA